MTVRAGRTPSTTDCVGAPPPRAGEDFGSVALRLAGFCGLQLGWSPDRFWNATPAEVAAVVAALVPAGAAPVTRGDIARLESEHG